ncbi:MAG TPA: PKD domain-containing protein [Acidimicrobiales bacterium]|nr:PKD domain-containing protein [Acidimicrobiales bacterium]
MTDSKTDGRGALFVTATSEDPRFNQPYIDIREWRDEPADAPVFPGTITTQHGGAAPVKARHLYIHGGFTGTDAKFSFCFPPEEEYEGRFFQATHQLLAGEEATARNVAFALASGGYSVQTNMGGSDNPRTAEQGASGQFDTTIRGYRVNAEAAKFSRVVAADIYGPHRTYGYLYGGSGGAYQTITSAEMTTGVWDGFVPYVMGSPQSIPGCFTVRVNALRVLKDKWPSIIDAIEPGGSGDPYAGLNDEESAALEEATRTGFPPRAWFNYVPQGGGPLVLVASYVPVLDPTYLEDFWSKPGYLGTDPTSSVRAARVQHEATVVEVISGGRQQLELSSVPTADLTGADVIITSGEAAGKTVMLGRFASDGKGQVGLVFESVGDTIDITADPSVVDSIHAGDEIRIDNSRFLALQTYHRHQFPPADPDFDYPDVYDYFRNPDRTAKYPQRGVDIGAAGTLGATGQIPTGRFNAKMIVVECLHDGDALPWQADWYRKKVEAVEGPHVDEKYRLWYVDNAHHTDPTTETQETHAVAYSGTVQYALRELSAWVEEGIAPPPTSEYSVQDGQVHVPATAAERKGIQPVVHLEVNGGERAEVAAGEAVTFTAQIAVPPAPGRVVSAKWDFGGVGTYPEAAELGDPTSETVQVTAAQTFSRPGTYFPALRVASQRERDPSTPFARSLNLSRVRVVVNE